MGKFPMMIGLAGPARAGKSTAARRMAAHYGYREVSFADSLREAARALNPIVHQDGMRWTLAEVTFGYEGAKDHPEYGAEFRGTLQRLGTEVGRQILGQDVWVNALLSSVDYIVQRVVIPDVRFPNEAAAITERGGVVIRIERDGYEPAGQHLSEHALDDWEFDYVLKNNGSVVELHQALDHVLQEVEGRDTVWR